MTNKPEGGYTLSGVQEVFVVDKLPANLNVDIFCVLVNGKGDYRLAFQTEDQDGKVLRRIDADASGSIESPMTPVNFSMTTMIPVERGGAHTVKLYANDLFISQQTFVVEQKPKVTFVRIEDL